MSEIVLYGASDDLLEVEGAFTEEFDALNGATVIVESPTGERLWVRAVFDSDPSLRDVGEGWVLSLLHADPTRVWRWPVRFGGRPDRPEDPALILECPDGTTVREWAA
ncbi:Uncharacterised protein [Mycobacteroides abscessus subsp. massiliense]|uniref:hypothetical protein n=1 Tax=Mycobacteroides abscessus TaxID=36809 RepID=UPI0009A66F8A|nr:hypothetical protein [Mycobacteroides abscessus]SKM82115.1 Uncharacterised protein [Mycobacteroides abscessus subsp. massiliense]SKM98839.1 Uncharacterised protein [Mycobacteroides abscessus subsp. massiliense]SKN77454.1 Uncharacterised protein [Mycobacteroides abscessus subsp. massiliense]SKN95760.1 Uncharacterised protein [Mycobacteroides abscessus subsp. massiliense]SKO22701.1 Uncharacterised protein [Mycobacteroides abscessus subsp. massiliense]